MASTIPVGLYGLRVPAGGEPIPASLEDHVAFRITMAAIDPAAKPELDEEHKIPRATLKVIRLEQYDDGLVEDGEDDDDDYDPDDIEAIRAKLREQGVLGSDDDSDMSEDDDDSDEEVNGGPSDPAKSKKAKQEAMKKKIEEDLDEMELDQLTNGVKGKGKGKGKALDGDLSSDDDEESEGGEEEFVLCTLDPEKNYQQTLEITVREGEKIFFAAHGSHDIYLTGNYIVTPKMYDSDDESDDEGAVPGLDYDLSPDEDELDLDESEEDELDDLQDPRITEVDSDEEDAPQLVKTQKKGKNKRLADSSDDEHATLDDLISKTKVEAPVTNGDTKLSKKQAKKLKNNNGQAVAAAQEPAKKEAAKDKTETPSSDKKKVQFAKNLELGPTGSPKVEEPKKEAAKGPRTVDGVTIEDRKDGKGKAAKKGDRVEMRYVGKLKNGKQFDANKRGKPFSFKLGAGEVIKGWDIGVVGMMAGSERRLTIPARHAYGSKSLPGIPANSDLIFDIKCISIS